MFAVQKTKVMGVIEGARHLPDQSNDFARREDRFALAQVIGQGGAVDELHGHVVVAVRRPRFIDAHDVGVLEPACVSLAQKAVQILLVVGELGGQHFECHHPLRVSIDGSVHDGHTAAPDFFLYAIVADLGDRRLHICSVLTLGCTGSQGVLVLTAEHEVAKEPVAISSFIQLA